MSTKGELRKQRKALAQQGYTFERGANGQLEVVRPRSPVQERRHADRMARWAKRYYDLNGAPEGPEDR